MRTTGAVHDPPTPLRKQDMRSWPADGMHERPIYDEQTQTLFRFDFNQSEQFVSKDTRESEFEVFMHQRLHLVLDYIHNVGKMSKTMNSLSTDEESLMAKKSEREVLFGLLLDACKLYVMSSGVSWDALGKYIESYKPLEELSMIT